MIPSVNDVLSAELEETEIPSKNYRMHFSDEVINGYNDNIEAMKQVIYKILNTERYQYIIYSWDYGIELMDLFGEPVDWVCSELERRITEALEADDRIEDVDGFEFDTSKRHEILVKFTVNTVFGDVEVEKAVNY